MTYALKLESVGKRYRIGAKEAMSDSLVGSVARWCTSPVSNFRRLKRLVSFSDGDDDHSVIWAIKDVDLEIKQGDVVGLIGANGAGKSTLLKLISRVTPPTTGTITLNGRVSSLLEVGTGFHNDLTGRENVYLNATILGMTKREVDRKFDEIVAFSGVEKFIDTPIKRYSSGMKMRLAFSIAAHLDPEILLIDEVLAVGDAAFQKKCLGKMEDVASNGRTVIFVSHNLSMVRSLCESSVVMNNGRVTFRGTVADGIAYYLRLAFPNDRDSAQMEVESSAGASGIYGMTIDGTNGSAIPTVGLGDAFVAVSTLVLAEPTTAGRIIGIVEDAQGTTLAHVSHDLGVLQRGRYKVRAGFPALWLAPGSYHLHLKFICGAGNKAVTRLVSEPIMFDSSGHVYGLGNKHPRLTPTVEWTITRSTT
jgi:lipopolysaccharide transport system ATP-binding protein